MGGTTGARLVGDAAGNRYVAKRGANPGHLREEATADAVYRAAGARVADFRLYEDPAAGDSPVKLARFVDGETLEDVRKRGDREKNARVKSGARKDFAVDALLANWDVVGLDHDNLMLGDDGLTYRMDNGGALRYRAMGARKSPGTFGEQVPELETMRDPSRSAGRVFGGMGDAEVARQIREDLSPRRGAIMDALPADDAELRGILSKRLDYMEDWAKDR